MRINDILTHNFIVLAVLSIGKVSCQDNVLRNVSSLSQFDNTTHENNVSRQLNKKMDGLLLDCQDDVDDDDTAEEEDIDRKRYLLSERNPCNANETMKSTSTTKGNDEDDLKAHNKVEKTSQGIEIKNEKEDIETEISNSTQTLMEVSETDLQNKLHVHVRTKGEPDIRNCGGCVALWQLHYAIEALNISTSNNRRDDRNYTACPSNDTFAEPIASGKTIVIVYPEGDTLTCNGPGNRVHVRWMLAPLGMNSRKSVVEYYGNDDLVFHFSSSCSSIADLPVNNILQIIKSPEEGDETDIPPEVFFNQDGRSGMMWMLRKAYPFKDKLEYFHTHMPRGMEVTQMETPTVSDFLKFEYFVSYDPFTFYTFIAAMSGTISIVSPIPNMSKKEWALNTFVGEYLRANGDGNIPGVAYGFYEPEIIYALDTMPKLREFLFKVKKWSKTTVPLFLRDSYRYGEGERNNFEGALLVHNAFPEYNNTKSKIRQFFDSHPRNGYGRTGRGGHDRKLRGRHIASTLASNEV